MPTFSFRAGETFTVNNLAGSGLGFYGASFGASVAVGAFQTTTFITNSNGTIEGPQVDNLKWTHNASGGINGAASVKLINIPNYLATLNIRFNHATAVKTQNGSVRIYDRADIDVPPVGLQARVAEIIHPDLTQVGDKGSGDTTWIWASGVDNIVPIVSSPGVSGESPSSTNTTDSQHDWYLAISASPDSIGSKTEFALYVTIEYL